MIFIIEEMYLVHREFQLTATSIILQVNMEFLMTLVFNLYYFVEFFITLLGLIFYTSIIKLLDFYLCVYICVFGMYSYNRQIILPEQCTL